MQRESGILTVLANSHRRDSLVLIIADEIN